MNGNLRWILGLALTIALALLGWTLQSTVSSYELTLTRIERVESDHMRNGGRLSSLETGYLAIDTRLARIEAGLDRLLEREINRVQPR